MKVMAAAHREGLCPFTLAGASAGTMLVRFSMYPSVQPTSALPACPRERGRGVSPAGKPLLSQGQPPTPAQPKQRVPTAVPRRDGGRQGSLDRCSPAPPQRGWLPPAPQNRGLFSPRTASAPPHGLGALPTFIWKKMLFQLVSLNL